MRWSLLVVLAISGCGRFNFDPIGGGDDAGGRDGLFGTTARASFLVDEVPTAGLTVLVHDAQGGLVSQTLSTTTAIDLDVPSGGYITAISGYADTRNNYDFLINTLAGVQPGDDLVFDLVNGNMDDASINLTLPAFGGASDYEISTPCDSGIMTGLSATVRFRPSCTQGGTYRILAQARDATGLPVAWSISATLPVGTTSYTMPAWQTGFVAVNAVGTTSPSWAEKFSVETIPIVAGLGDAAPFYNEVGVTGGQPLSSAGQIVPGLTSEWIYYSHVRTSAVSPPLPLVGEYLHTTAPPGQVTFGADQLDVFANGSFTGTAPRLGLDTTVPAGLDAVLLVLLWTTGGGSGVQWQAVFDPATPTPYLFLELPASLANMAPVTMNQAIVLGIESNGIATYADARTRLFTPPASLLPQISERLRVSVIIY